MLTAEPIKSNPETSPGPKKPLKGRKKPHTAIYFSPMSAYHDVKFTCQ